MSLEAVGMILGHHRRLATIVLAGALYAVAPNGGRAQMQLSGSHNGVPVGGSPAPESSGGSGGEAPYIPPKPVILKSPSIDTIVGHRFAHDGARGAMTFDKSGDGLVLSQLTMTGDRISAPAKACSIDVALAPPLVATLDGRPSGAIRYSIPIIACPFSIDVLDGAVLVLSPEPHCDFVAADCRISPGGLWGPTALEITPQQIKDLERERVRVETTMRTDFRALLKRAGKDKTAVKALASEQAGFSSDREVACRDYAQESAHGFCSTRITEARVLALIAKFGDEADRAAPRRRSRAKPPADGSQTAPTVAPGAR